MRGLHGRSRLPRAGSAGRRRYVPGRASDADGVTAASSRDIPSRRVVEGVRLGRRSTRSCSGRSPTARRSTQARARLTQAQELRSARAGATRYPRGRPDRGRRAPAHRSGDVRLSRRRRIPGRSTSSASAPTRRYDFDIFGGTRRELEGARGRGRLPALRARRRAADAREQRRRGGDPAGGAARRRSKLTRSDPRRAAARARHRRGALSTRAAWRWLTVQNQRALVARDRGAGCRRSCAAVAQAGHLLAVLMGEPPAARRRPADRAWPTCACRRRCRCGCRPSSSASGPTSAASEALLHKASANVGRRDRRPLPQDSRSPAGFRRASSASGRSLRQRDQHLEHRHQSCCSRCFAAASCKARKRAAEAAYEQALAAYRQTVLQGLQNVADVLRSLEADAGVVAARSEQAGPGRGRLADHARALSAGGVSEVALLDAERQRLAAQAAGSARRRRLGDAAALFQALGGGAREDVDVPARCRPREPSSSADSPRRLDVRRDLPLTAGGVIVL